MSRKYFKASPELKLKAQTMYLSGYSQRQIAEELGLSFRLVKSWRESQNWASQKAKAEETTQVMLAEFVGTAEAQKAIDIVEPLLNKLSERALALLDTEEELTSKDYIRTLTPLVKLKSQLTGELKSQNNPNSEYLAMMKLIKDFPKDSTESILMDRPKRILIE